MDLTTENHVTIEGYRYDEKHAVQNNKMSNKKKVPAFFGVFPAATERLGGCRQEILSCLK